MVPMASVLSGFTYHIPACTDTVEIARHSFLFSNIVFMHLDLHVTQHNDMRAELQLIELWGSKGTKSTQYMSALLFVSFAKCI